MLCSECKFFQQGQCWRYPPTLGFVVVPVQKLTGNELTIQRVAARPAVPSDHWCGEFKPEGVILS